METKDLVLLMMIPIILVSLIAYTNKAPTIIGAVTAEQEQGKILGTYSVNPSFKVSIDYNIEEYNNIRQKLKILVEECKNDEDIEQCFKSKSDKKWNCEENDNTKAVLYDFVDKFSECLNLNENGVVCSFSFDNRKITSRIFNIMLTSENQQIKAELMEFGNVLQTAYINQEEIHYVTDYNTRDQAGELADFVNIVVKYTEGKPAIDVNAKPINIQSEIKLSKFLFYKDNDEVKFIDIAQEGSFRAPAIKIINLPKIKGAKFCIKSQSKPIYVYDSSDNQVKQRDIVHKFAVTYPDMAPKPLKLVEAYDRPKADKSVLVKWEKSKEKDVVKYRIYYADSILKIFDKTPTENLMKNPGVFAKDIILSDIFIEGFNNALNPTGCEFEFESKKCIFSTIGGEKTNLDKEKLYYFKDQNFYIYNIVLPENKKNYDITVTAIDKNNNEINNVDDNQKLPVVKNVQSIDDLPPSSEGIVILRLQQIYDETSKKVTFNFAQSPKINADGSTLKDFKNYLVYYIKYSLLTQQQKAEVINSIMNSELNKLKLIQTINYEQQGYPFFIDLSSTNLQSGNVYFFVIIASDNLGNPKEDQFKVKELGAIPLQLTIS